METPSLAILALAFALVGAGCLGTSDGGASDGDDEAAAPTAQSPAGNGTATNGTTDELPLVERATVSVQAGAGRPGGPWLFLGSPEASLEVPENATSLTVYANLTDPGANATGPGAGMVGFEVVHGGSLVETSGDTPTRSFSFETDAEPGEWIVRAVPHGPAANRQAVVTFFVQ